MNIRYKREKERNTRYQAIDTKVTIGIKNNIFWCPARTVKFITNYHISKFDKKEIEVFKKNYSFIHLL